MRQLQNSRRKCLICERNFLAHLLKNARTLIQTSFPFSMFRREWKSRWRTSKKQKNRCQGAYPPAEEKAHAGRTAPALIEKSYATPSLVSDILKNKFVLGLPFYRQEQDLKRSGIRITRASMAAWTILVFQLYFQWVVQFFHRELLKRQFLMMDETPVQVLKEPDKRPQSKSYVWLLRSGENGLPPLLLYRYSLTRNGDNAVEMRSFF